MNVATRVFEAMAHDLVEMARRLDVSIVVPRKADIA